MSSGNELRFFSTAVHDCSYLPGHRASTLFADPERNMNVALYSHLSRIGFRRSGDFVYRPHCGPCQACVPVRIPVAQFHPTRQHRRTWQMNADLAVSWERPGLTEERYALYATYIGRRHSDGDMYPPSRDQYRSFLLSTWSDLMFLEFRLQGRLVAVAVCDWLQDGLSATYTFYDPELHARSLGTYAILCQIESCRRLDLHALYLGYWIKESPKMAYKARFRPLELYVHDAWLLAR